MKLEDIVLELGVRKDFGKIEPNDAGIYYVVANEKSVVAIEKSLDEKGFYIYSSVGVLPEGLEEELGLKALAGNLFGKETGHATLGFHSDTRSLILFQYFAEEPLTIMEFENSFDLFVNYLAYWVEKVEAVELADFEKISLERHLLDLTDHKKIKLFFA